MSEQKLYSAKEITPGPIIPKPATSLENKTGSWRSFRPIVDKNKCTGCLFCWIFCPDSAIKREKMEKGFKVHVDYDYCKGCGICANTCPVKAIIMEKEG
jgi:pyruvate ferredoxin oxidoreductase delta subunit